MRNKIPHILFQSEKSLVEVPIDVVTADRIVAYLHQLGVPQVEPKESDPLELE